MYATRFRISQTSLTVPDARALGFELGLEFVVSCCPSLPRAPSIPSDVVDVVTVVTADRVVVARLLAQAAPP